MKKFVGIAAFVITALVALGVTGYAYAQSATPTADDTTPEVHRGPGGIHGLRGVDLRSYLEAAQAEAFGVTVEELQALQDAGKSLKDLAVEQDLTVAEYQSRKDAAFASALEQAVADGVLTQAQADELTQRQADRPTGPRHDGDRPLQTYFDAATAEAFGISVDELQALRDAGQGVKDLAIEQDLKMVDYLSRLESIKTNALEQAVADGAITQEQADAFAAHSGGKGPGGHAGPGGRGCGKGMQLPAAEDSEATTP